MNPDEEVAGVDYRKDWGVILVHRSGRVIRRMTAAVAVDFGDLQGQRISAPIGGIRWSEAGKGYWIWLIDGNIHYFGDSAESTESGEEPRPWARQNTWT